MRAWLLPVVLFVAACGGNSGDAASGPKAIGGSCSGAADSGKSCDSTMCLGLMANAQKQGGICSKGCQIDDDCGGTANVCVDLAGDGSGYCLRTCKTGKDCNGFACLSLDDPEAPISICFVEPPADGTGGANGSGGTTGTGAGADCKSKDCDITTDPAMVAGYCAMAPSAKKLCDCPSLDVPPTCVLTIPAAANLYCCP
jgi:hypothetical protein